MTFKYLAWACALTVAVAACTPQTTTPSSGAAGVATATAPLPRRPTRALAAPVGATLEFVGRWHLVPDPLFSETFHVTATFASDPAEGFPRLRIRGTDREILLERSSQLNYAGTIDLTGLGSGEQTVDAVVRVRGAGDVVAGTGTFLLSQPEYVVWTLDFEGDASGDAELANTVAIADGLRVPMTILWNPRVWTTNTVTRPRAEAMLAWAKQRQSLGDEVGLHLHMWADYVRAAGWVPRLAPSWAGRSDGYDVPMTAYSEDEQRALIAYGVQLMIDHGFPRPTSFRAGGDFGDAATLRALVASGFTADCTAVGAGSFGRLRWPWTLAADAQPYRPSRDDANVSGDLPLLEAPTIGGNTFGYTAASIVPVARADLSFLAPTGEVAKARRAITIVSHPSTVDATERAAIETLLGSFAPLRFDRDAGPVVFVTLAQLARAFAL